MKIQNKNTKKKFAPVIIVAALVLLGLGAFFAYTYFTQKNQPQHNTSNSQHQDTSNTDKKNNDSKTEDKDTTSDLNNSVAIPPAPHEATDAPFPIENAHYRIQQNSPTSYTITLNAIINNPNQYNEYRQQLKQYKTEALDYLKSRFSSTDNFTFTWNPDDAKDI